MTEEEWHAFSEGGAQVTAYTTSTASSSPTPPTRRIISARRSSGSSGRAGCRSWRLLTRSSIPPISRSGARMVHAPSLAAAVLRHRLRPHRLVEVETVADDCAGDAD